MGLYNHALYQVATKALIFDGDRVLVLETPDGFIDFPGGRVDESERDVPWTNALRREIAEEIGRSVQVDVGQTLFVSKRQYHKDGQTYHIAAIFFDCQYQSGDITLSDEHGSYGWLTLQQLLADHRQFVSEDERTQLRAYLAD